MSSGIWNWTELNVCLRCDHKWNGKWDAASCPNCRNFNWDISKKEKVVVVTNNTNDRTNIFATVRGRGRFVARRFR